MRVERLWRYPVKSLGGEALTSAVLTMDGVFGDRVFGDRVFHVRGARGPLTGRTRHALLTIPVRTDAEGTVLVDGHPWDALGAAALLQERAGADAALVADGSPQRFDVLNLLVATDEAVARFGHDVRRLRPNILISGIASGTEADWPGQALAVGDAMLAFTRCAPAASSPLSTPIPASRTSTSCGRSGETSAANSP
jgi:hypothetical protein